MLVYVLITSVIYPRILSTDGQLNIRGGIMHGPCLDLPSAPSSYF